jgi:hypothetical protein
MELSDNIDSLWIIIFRLVSDLYSTLPPNGTFR